MKPTATANEGVEAIVLAGSYPWSRSAFDRLLPRPLLPVAGRTIVERVVDWLGHAGVERGVVCVNDSTKAVRQHFATSSPPALHLQFYEDETPRGPAGCVKDAARHLEARTLVVADGSSIPAFALGPMLDQHRRSGAALTIAAYGSPGQPAALYPVDVYVIDRRALESVPSVSFQDIKEGLVPRLYGQGHVMQTFKVDRVSPRVLNANSYLALNHWMLEGMRRESTAHVPAWIDPTAVVDPSALIIGPVLIGAGARVESNATLVGPSSIGAGTVIERDATVSRSVIWSRCRIGRGARVDLAIVGDGSIAGPGDELVRTVHLRPAAPRLDWWRRSGLAVEPEQPESTSPRPGVWAHVGASFEQLAHATCRRVFRRDDSSRHVASDSRSRV